MKFKRPGKFRAEYIFKTFIFNFKGKADFLRFPERTRRVHLQEMRVPMRDKRVDKSSVAAQGFGAPGHPAMEEERQLRVTSPGLPTQGDGLDGARSL